MRPITPRHAWREASLIQRRNRQRGLRRSASLTSTIAEIMIAGAIDAPMRYTREQGITAHSPPAPLPPRVVEADIGVPAR